MKKLIIAMTLVVFTSGCPFWFWFLSQLYIGNLHLNDPVMFGVSGGPGLGASSY